MTKIIKMITQKEGITAVQSKLSISNWPHLKSFKHIFTVLVIFQFEIIIDSISL